MFKELIDRIIDKKRRMAPSNKDIIQELYAMGEADRLRHEELRDKFTVLENHIKIQNEVSAVNFKAFDEYHNCNIGKEVVILGNGPTLNDYIPIKNAIHIGVNRANKSNKVKLDYLFIQDFEGIKLDYFVDLEKEDLKKTKIFIGKFYQPIAPLYEASESDLVTDNANFTRYFVSNSPSRYIYNDIRFHPLMDFNSVAFPAIHFALFTNPSKIYLVGCDSSYGGYFSGESNITDNIQGAREIRIHMLLGYREIKKHVDQNYPETEIISINPVVLKGFFKDMYTENGKYVENSVETSEAFSFSDEAIYEREREAFIDAVGENDSRIDDFEYSIDDICYSCN